MRQRTRVAAVSAGVAILLIVLLWHFAARQSLKLPTGKGRAVATMGFSHGVILASDGSLWVWGQQDLGWPALGMGNVEHQPSLKRLGKDRDWVDATADIAHTLALKADALYGPGAKTTVGNWATAPERCAQRWFLRFPDMIGNRWQQGITSWL